MTRRKFKLFNQNIKVNLITQMSPLLWDVLTLHNFATKSDLRGITYCHYCLIPPKRECSSLLRRQKESIRLWIVFQMNYLGTIENTTKWSCQEPRGEKMIWIGAPRPRHTYLHAYEGIWHYNYVWILRASHKNYYCYQIFSNGNGLLQANYVHPGTCFQANCDASSYVHVR